MTQLPRHSPSTTIRLGLVLLAVAMYLVFACTIAGLQPAAYPAPNGPVPGPGAGLGL